MSAKGNTAIEVLFNEEAFARLRAGRKYAPIAAAVTTVITSAIASFHSTRLPEAVSTAKGVASASTVASVAWCAVECDVATSGGPAPVSSVTGATNRYPRLGN